MRWRWTIIEQMSKMRSASRAFHLVARHSMTGICLVGDFVFGQRRIETGPAGVRFKLCVRAEQFVSACPTEINSFFVIVPIRVLVWRLCFGFAQDLKLSGSQNLSPLVITQRHLLRHRSRLDLPSNLSGCCVVRHAEANEYDAQQKEAKRSHSLSA